MTNDITIDVNEILTLPDYSISDGETIRQIGLATTTYNYVSQEVANQLCRKIKTGFEVHALYPHVMRPLNILPDGIDEETKEKFNEILSKIKDNKHF